MSPTRSSRCGAERREASLAWPRRATQSTALGQTATASGVGGTAVGFGSIASGANSTASGRSSVATGSQSSAFGAGATASGTRAVAIGAGASASAPNAVALGAGSVATLANTMSVGAPGGERRITNVAAGISQTDAVNVGQLQSFAAGFQSQIGGLQSQIIQNTSRHGAASPRRQRSLQGSCLRPPAGRPSRSMVVFTTASLVLASAFRTVSTCRCR
jgi:Coiled stalk of trimeric autotransporter adhesin/YadA head domain repeat (2 copies)